jgi:diguanylate cyclase (GGDEF)-like protein
MLKWLDNWEVEKTVYRMILKGVGVVAFLMSGIDYLFYSEELALLEFVFAMVSFTLLQCAISQRLRYNFSSRIFIFFMAIPIYWNLLYNTSAIESTVLFIFLPIITVILRPLREVLFFAILFGGSFLTISFSSIGAADFTYIELFKIISMQALISFFVTIYVQTNKNYQEVISKQSKALQDANTKLEELYKEREIEAYTDALTGLTNRLAMMHRLEYLYARYKRQKEIFSLVLFDIDYFKQVNDNYGHQVGDDVLKEVAQIALKSIREVDTAARYGGEEFVVLLPQTNIVSAVEIAERIRTSMQKTIKLDDKSVTASFGVIEIKENMSIEALIKLADEALYKAKAAGRNQVMSTT